MWLSAVTVYLAIGALIVKTLARAAPNLISLPQILAVVLFWPFAIVFPLLLLIDWLRRG